MKNNSQILYKYRRIENFKFFMDILVNNRLFAATYESLNDPMEGHYLYHDGQLNEYTREIIYDQKVQVKLCSLSKDNDNFLMWSHYANGHKGVAIGVTIDSEKYKIRDIDYTEQLPHITNLDRDTAENILSKKMNFWKYENEVRVFTKNTNFIDVTVKEIIAGGKMTNTDYEFIQKLVKLINPKIIVRKRIL